MTAVDIRVANPLLPHIDTTLEAIGATEILRKDDLDQPGITILTIDAPDAPAGARTMTFGLAFATDRPAYVSSATYFDESGADIKTVAYP